MKETPPSEIIPHLSDDLDPDYLKDCGFRTMQDPAGFPLESIFSGVELEALKTKILDRRGGLILSIGKICSGKTSVLESMLNFYYNSIEEPRILTVEYYMEMNVGGENPKCSVSKIDLKKVHNENISFAELLPNLVRMRPDVMGIDDLQPDSAVEEINHYASRGENFFVAMSVESFAEALTVLGNVDTLEAVIINERFHHSYGVNSPVFLSGVIFMTDEVREASKIFLTDGDENRLNETMKALKASQLQEKKQELVGKGLLYLYHHENNVSGSLL